MPKSIDDPQEVLKILLARAGRNATLHLREMDMASGTIALELGLINDMQVDGAAITSLCELLEDPGHKRRVDIGAGPVLVHQVAETDHSIVFLTDRFRTRDRRLRRALLKSWPRLMGPSTRRCTRERHPTTLLCPIRSTRT